jgi:hypothetical protein
VHIEPSLESKVSLLYHLHYADGVEVLAGDVTGGTNQKVAEKRKLQRRERSWEGPPSQKRRKEDKGAVKKILMVVVEKLETGRRKGRTGKRGTESTKTKGGNKGPQKSWLRSFQIRIGIC